MGTTSSRIYSHRGTVGRRGDGTTCRLGNGGGEWNLGFDEDAVMRENLGSR